MPIDLARWEPRFEAHVRDRLTAADGAHDLAHVRRVVAAARRLAEAEGARLGVVLPAAWLHDVVTVPKDDPRRKHASRLAADHARAFLAGGGYPAALLDDVHHAVAAHSFSAGIAPETVEAKVVQDADRLDALGAVGIARCLLVGGALGRPLYDEADPFAARRPADDGAFTLDHFFVKLLRLAGTMQTAAGRAEAERRTAFMRRYLDELGHEIDVAATAGG